MSIDFNNGYGGRTRLDAANKKRWALTGQLSRTAGLIRITANTLQYPADRELLQQAADVLDAEVKSINIQYKEYKEHLILLLRVQLPERKVT